jgi:histone deacetylase 1/2
MLDSALPLGEFETFYFGQNHPMKPHRLAMTHHLVLGYGLHEKMEVYVSVHGHECCKYVTESETLEGSSQKPRKAYPVELAQFHASDYVEFLSRITPDNAKKYAQQLSMYNISDDCPVFDGLFK